MSASEYAAGVKFVIASGSASDVPVRPGNGLRSVRAGE
jgi:hypothetical protein